MKYIYIFLLIALFIAPSQATAQGIINAPQNEATVIEDMYGSTYLDPTLENLSKLYWRLGAFDAKQDIAIDNFLRIHECDIYVDNVNNDFKWSQIREATRESIKYNKRKNNYPNQFKFTLSAELGRYDTEKRGFFLINDSAFLHMKRLQITNSFVVDEICNERAFLKDYPVNIMLVLENEFHLDFIELDEHIAQAFLIRKQNLYKGLKDKKRLSQYRRDVFIRLRTTILEFQGLIESAVGTDGEQAILYAHIDGYDIFEDPMLTRLLKSVDYSE